MLARTHTQSMYQIAFPASEFAAFLPWLMLNRNGLIILLHPETGSSPTRTVSDALDLTKAAIAAGSESTTPSRTTEPVSLTTQIDVCFNDTSNPT
jgi:DOPA 4,5-dioxygenase